MFPGNTLLFIGLALSLSLTSLAAKGAGVPGRDFPPADQARHLRRKGLSIYAHCRRKRDLTNKTAPLFNCQRTRAFEKN
jgi:hypothetical protein